MAKLDSKRAVLMLSQEPPPFHGSTVMTVTLRRVLQTLGHEVVLIDRRFSRDVGEIGQFTARKGLQVVGLLIRVATATRNHNRSPLIFFSTNRPGSFLVDCLIGEVLRVQRTTVIHYIHTRGYTDLAARGWLWKFLVARLLQLAHEVVVLGPSLEDDIRPWLRPGTRLSSVPNTVPDRQPIATVRSESKRTVLFMSNLLEEKGGLTFANVAVELASSFPQIDFRIAGAHGDLRHVEDIREVISRAGMGNRIFLLGPVGDEKWALFERSKVLVFPSSYVYEAQPLTILEAMSYGVPTIAFDVGGIRDLIVEGVNGRLVPPGDVPALARGISELLSDSAAVDILQRGASQQYQREFAEASYAAKWGRILDRGMRVKS
jgi:glycosyltransferase involved in cell wall biosynthesis